MIYALGDKKFSLDTDKLCIGHYDHLKLWRSTGVRGSTETSGTIDILFVESKALFLWVPVK